MFSFSFTARQKSLDAQRHIRRLVDLTVPNNEALNNSGRFENRYNRTIPVLICTIRDGKADPKDAVIAITKDLSDRGAGIVTGEPIDSPDVIVAFCVDNQPWYFQGVCHVKLPIGGGFWLNGLELTEFLQPGSRSELSGLAPIARQLQPPDSLDRAETLLKSALS